MAKNGIQPGATIGLLGGGQLGRMFAIEARKMGCRVHTFEPSTDSPAGQIADQEFTGAYEDVKMLDEFAASVDVVTFEFENIPANVVERIALQKPVHPRAGVLHICQNREREKKFLLDHSYPMVAYRIVASSADLADALRIINSPAVLKTGDFGYDGKGQVKVNPTNPALDVDDIWQSFGAPRAILEKWITHVCELSVVVARNAAGQCQTFPVSENVHHQHILDLSIVPARVSEKVQKKAAQLAVSIAEDLELVGLLAVEFFLTDSGSLLVNELAPRPHNSGHFTFDACVTSQFEQQLRAVCGWPFGSSRLLSPIVMVNLLGDLWKNEQAPDFRPILLEPDARLHLYGKMEGRKGRKMGHFCVLKPTIEEALATALRIQSELS